MLVEVLRSHVPSGTAEAMLKALAVAATAAGDVVVQSARYRGHSELLVLFGIGAPGCDEARRAQIARGGRVLIWDLGYFGRAKLTGFLRASINHDHPQALLDATEPEPSRWDAHHIELREDAKPGGLILVIGLGTKSRRYLKDRVDDWEQRQIEGLKLRFPGRTIMHRPKPGHVYPELYCERDIDTPIAELLKRCALVVCRHSNVAVDATIAGVPFEAEDGAATWLAERAFTRENRLDFLRRLAWWQWQSIEAPAAWTFLKHRAP